MFLMTFFTALDSIKQDRFLYLKVLNVDMNQCQTRQVKEESFSLYTFNLFFQNITFN